MRAFYRLFTGVAVVVSVMTSVVMLRLALAPLLRLNSRLSCSGKPKTDVPRLVHRTFLLSAS